MIRKNILSLSIVFLSLVMNGFSQTEEVSLTNLSSINSSRMEFGAVPYGSGLMFTSTNGEKFKGKIDKCNTADYFAKLFYADRDDMAGLTEDASQTGGDMVANTAGNGGVSCGFKNAFPISGDVQGKFHDGTPTISPDGNQMIFSRNYPGKSNFMNACNDGQLNLRLMSVDKVGEQWTNIQELPLNGEDFITTHPALSADGNCLYFASNRPGGVGGMDLYKSCKDGDTWGIPTNLGAPINTAGNEIFPYVAANGDLYFSSNGMVGGLGGLDIYTSSMTGGSWTTPSNLGQPFNSSADDLGYTLMPDGESGYLTSNREGGKGGDDIYCWRVNKAAVSLAVEDAQSKSRITNALVKITEKSQTRDYTTNTEGLATPDIAYRRTYQLEVVEPGYEPWSKGVSASELARENPYIVPLVKRLFPLAGNVVWEDNTAVPGSRVVLYNLTTGDSTVVTANGEGKFDINISCLDDYELVAYKDGKTSSRKSLPASSIDCSGGSNAVTLVLPKPAPSKTIAPICNCTGNPNPVFNIPVAAKPKRIHRLGSRPEFGNSKDLTGAAFYDKLMKRYQSNAKDAQFLDELFQGMGYTGFADANATAFREVTLSPGITGNMGYTTRHKIKYIELDTRGDDLEAFRVEALNGCHLHFMKTCGNHFFFCAGR